MASFQRIQRIAIPTARKLRSPNQRPRRRPNVANWKTTLAGLFTAAFNIAANGHNWKQFAVSFCVALVGILAQDAGVAPSK